MAEDDARETEQEHASRLLLSNFLITTDPLLEHVLLVLDSKAAPHIATASTSILYGTQRRDTYGQYFNQSKLG